MTENNTNPEDTGQISVAELLARNGQKAGLSAGGRRRRGVKGGISVAELTGEIPVVRDEPTAGEAPVIEPEPGAAPKPADSEPADSEPADSKPADSKRVQPEPELLSGSTTAAGDLLNKAHDDNERRPYGSVPSQRPVPITSRSRSTGFVQRGRAERTERDDEPKTDVTARTDAAPRPVVAPKPIAPKPVAPKPVAPDAEKPQTKAEAKSDASGNDSTAKSTTTLKPVTRAMPAVERPADKPSLDKPSRDEDADDAVTEITDAVTSDSDNAPATPAKKDAAKQWLVLAGQGVVAIVVGALLFKGFEKLWDMLPWVALILAVLVIVGLVAVVRILRRTDDMISMVIAIAVGVFVTLGPLAFQLSTG